jgi:hypothetical protein
MYNLLIKEFIRGKALPSTYEYLAVCLHKLMEPGGRQGAYGLGNDDALV